MKKRILFIHHSTGGYLLQYGDIRRKLYSQTDNIELWDHGYNLSPILPNLVAKYLPIFQTGLSDYKGNPTGKDFNLEISNKDVSYYLPIFSRNNPYLKEMLDFDGIIFKMCYPSTKIFSDMHLAQIKETYLEINKKLMNFKQTEFGIFTPPPLRLEMTTTESANRVVSLRKWMLQNLPCKNIKIFDFFGLIADLNTNSKYYGTLQREYCRPLWFDSHPNRKGNINASDKFVDFIRNLTI